MAAERTPPPDRSHGESYPGPAPPGGADEPYDTSGDPGDNAPDEQQPPHPEKPRREDA
jgi:hypothetical protein